MARKTYVFQTNPNGTYKEPLEMVEKSQLKYPFYGERTDTRAHNIIGDIEPYQSTIDGSIITSRAKHRQHLREHGCVEIGTENMDRAKQHFKKPGHKGGVTADVLKAFEKSG